MLKACCPLADSISSLHGTSKHLHEATIYHPRDGSPGAAWSGRAPMADPTSL